MLWFALALSAAAAEPPAACRAAVALFEKGQMTAALPALAAAQRDHPASAYCAKALGTALAATGDYRRAEAPLGLACRLDPALPDACYYWARTLYSLDRFEESLAALAQAAPSATAVWRLGTARGQALDALGRREAEAVLQQALAARQRDAQPLAEPDPRLALAAFLYREGRGAEALTLLRAAPPAYQSLPAFHYQLGRALAQTEAWRDAATALEQAIALKPDYAEAHGLLSRCYHRLGQPELAQRHAARAK